MIRYDYDIPKYNTDDGRKQIVKEYGKYILSEEYYENSNIDKLYSTLRTDTRTLSYIITYYNIFEILKTFFLGNGCILHNKFFIEKYNQREGANEIKKSKEKIYVKVKSINCIKFTDEMIRSAFENDSIIKPIYEIEFEEIPTYSNLIFYVNFIDLLNPNRQTEETLEYYQREFPHDRKTITEINSETLIYRRHTNNMFSKNKKIHPRKIYINKKMIIKKMVEKFSIIKSNNKIFKTLNVQTKKDALMISETFTAIVEEKELKYIKHNEDDIEKKKDIEKLIEKYIFNYYLEKFYFKIDEYLFVDGKYAQIKKVKYRLLNRMSYNELRNNKLESKDTEKKYLGIIPSVSTRLAIDDVDNSYYVYLDVDVIFKNSPTDKIPIKDKINYQNNCIGKATVLDLLLYNTLGINYPKRYLENKLRKKNNSLETTRKKKIVNSALLEQKSKKELPSKKKPQIGGVNINLTRKIINKKNNKTLKNLLHYYTI